MGMSRGVMPWENVSPGIDARYIGLDHGATQLRIQDMVYHDPANFRNIQHGNFKDLQPSDFCGLEKALEIVAPLFDPSRIRIAAIVGSTRYDEHFQYQHSRHSALMNVNEAFEQFLGSGIKVKGSQEYLFSFRVDAFPIILGPNGGEFVAEYASGPESLQKNDQRFQDTLRMMTTLYERFRESGLVQHNR